MFTAKSAFPIASSSPVHVALFSRAASAPFALFTCLPGYLSKGALAEALAKGGRPVMWLRLGQEDRDPATLLLSLIQSARRLQPGVGGITLEKMKLNPGPLAGWPALYTLFSQELADGLPPSTALVLEDVHHLAAEHGTLGLLSNQLLARLPNLFARIMTTFRDLPGLSVSLPAEHYGVRELKIDYQAGLALAEDYYAKLSKECLLKALNLFDGRGPALAGLLAACQELGPSFMQSSILRARTADQLLTSLLRASLSASSGDEIVALSLVFNLDYCHPELSQAAFGTPTIPHGPYLQSLSDGWSRLLQAWRGPLRAAFRAEHREIKDASLISLAEYLARQGAVENAVQLCFVKKFYDLAARLMASAAEEMMDRGQWATLEGWLQQLPRDVMYEWPRLVYTQGEIAAADGRIAEARRIFAVSSDLFPRRGESEGTCQSLLAQSTLAAWEGDKSTARNFARSASALANKAGLTDKMGDINWQLASLALAAGKLEDALAYLVRVEDTPTDPLLAKLFDVTAKLLQNQIGWQGQRKSQYQAYLETVQAEQGNLVSLQRLMNSPAPNLPELFERRGWSNTPLLLKLAAPMQLPENLEEETKPNILQRLLQALPLSRLGTVTPESGSQIGKYIAPADALIYAQLEPIQPPSTSPVTTSEPIAIPELSARLEEPAAGVISAHLLGSFRLSINEIALTRLPSNRGLAILKYVLMHHTQLIPRDVLMDTFWPDADPESARNSLNVSLHSLRQALHSISPLPLIVFESGKYCLNSDLKVWVDVENFERHMKTGKRLEETGQLASAIREYEAATSLYQGDLLADDPYEEWPVIAREHLRIAYLDMLDQLSQIYFNQEQYGSSIALCQRILGRDNCREDAHRRLMCCYSRQGQQHMAIRQYQTCVESLRSELDVDPQKSTLELYERIRRQEQV